MVAVSTGPTAVERLTQGSTDRKYGSGRKRTACVSENIDAVKELVLSQEDAPGTHRTVRHFEHKT